MADLLGDHAQLLEVDEAVHLAVVAQVDEGQVLLHHREDRDLGGQPTSQVRCVNNNHDECGVVVRTLCLLFEVVGLYTLFCALVD